MDMFIFKALVLIGICAGCFSVGAWDAENTLFKQCLDKNEIVINDVRFYCVPKTVKVGDKEVPY